MAALLRFAAIAIVRSYRHPETWEFGYLARSILHGTGFSFDGVTPSAFMPPGYPYLLAGLWHVFGQGQGTWLALSLGQALLGVALVYLVYLLSLEIYGRASLAWLAGLAAAIYPPLVYMCTEFHPISFYSPLGVAAVLLLLRARRRQGCWRDAVWAACCVGLLLLFRAEALLLCVCYAGLLLWPFGWRNVARATAYLAISLLFVAPWVARNEQVFHKLIPTTTSLGLNLWIGNNPRATGSDRGGSQQIPDALRTRFALLSPRVEDQPDPAYELERDQALKTAAEEYMRAHPGQELRLAGRKLFRFFLFDPLHEKGRKPAYWIPSALLTCLAVMGLLAGPRVSLWELAPIAIAIGEAVALAVLLFALPRYKIVCDPFLCVFAAAAFWPWLKGLRGAKSAAAG